MMTNVSGNTFAVRITPAILFAISFAFVEAVVVVYLRGVVYPEGFAFPLKLIPSELIIVELMREAATVIMLGTVAALCGRRLWERFGYFIVIFGVWDIFYYIWLKATINWPGSLFEWDVLFLIPLPWIGPVIAPVLVSLTMIACGLPITRLCARGQSFLPGAISWALAATATALILFSFMRDTGATLNQQMPQPYWYPLLAAGLLMYIGAFLTAFVKSKRAGRNDAAVNP